MQPSRKGWQLDPKRWEMRGLLFMEKQEKCLKMKNHLTRVQHPQIILSNNTDRTIDCGFSISDPAGMESDDRLKRGDISPVTPQITWCTEWKGEAEGTGLRSRKMEEERETMTLLPVCDSRLGDSRPGRPGCSSLGLSWIPAPEQRFGGRPGRELEGERQRDWLHRIRVTALSTQRWRDNYISCWLSGPSLMPCDMYLHYPQSCLKQNQQNNPLIHSWLKSDIFSFNLFNFHLMWSYFFFFFIKKKEKSWV